MLSSSSPRSLEYFLTRHKENNFGFIRQLAALLVLLNHSFQWIGSGQDPVSSATRGLLTGSSLGVDTFFFLSGILVTHSIRQSASWKDYCWRRALRIYPGAVAAILICALIAGPILTILPLKEYFLHPELYEFLGGILLFRVHYTLPGVIHYHGQDLSLISSFWSISLELKLYLLLLLGWIARIKYKRNLLLFIIGLGLTFNLLFFDRTVSIFARLIPIHFNPFSYTLLGLLFLMGTACEVFRKNIYINNFWILILLPLLALGILCQFWFLTTFILIPAFILYTATHGRYWIRRLTPRADLSYGIYIYGAAVGKVLFFYLHPTNPWLNFLMSLAAVVPLALFSWYCIEKPMLSYKKKMAARSEPHRTITFL